MPDIATKDSSRIKELDSPLLPLEVARATISMRAETRKKTGRMTVRPMVLKGSSRIRSQIAGKSRARKMLRLWRLVEPRVEAQGLVVLEQVLVRLQL